MLGKEEVFFCLEKYLPPGKAIRDRIYQHDSKEATRCSDLQECIETQSDELNDGENNIKLHSAKRHFEMK
jgi:hypothetical protein